jgi:Single-strand binding protein family
MTIRAIVTGVVHKPVEIRTSKTGNEFAILTIRENVNGVTRWIQCISFSKTAIEILQKMDAGEAISAAGELSAEIYSPAGAESRINWKLIVDGVLSARKPLAKPERVKHQRRAAGGFEAAARSWAAPSGMGGDDGRPF